MPPPTDLDPAAALDLWPTFTKALEALRSTGEIDPIGCCRTTTAAAVVERNSVPYYFEADDRDLAKRVADLQPTVVHIHGLGFTRLLVASATPSVAASRSCCSITVSYRRRRARSRVVRRRQRHMVDGYLFTGAQGQAEPFRRAGAISRTAPVYEVLESASHLDTDIVRPEPGVAGPSTRRASVRVVGRPVDPVEGSALCGPCGFQCPLASGDAELHMLATDRSMEPDVRELVTTLGLTDRCTYIPGRTRRDGRLVPPTDVYLSTSHHEGSNYSLIEALGFGASRSSPTFRHTPRSSRNWQECFPSAITSGRRSCDGADASRQVVVGHAQQWLSWAAIADQLATIYSDAAGPKPNV
jgi:hypothetical protein